MQFETLSHQHAAALLEFECQNRGYFERSISPRPAEFYSEAGVHAHIESALTRSEEMRGQFYLGVQAGQIIARANLNQIFADQHAQIGYRVAERATGQGVASACVAFLVDVARRSGLQKLSAVVMSNNRASACVLLKNRFQWVQSEPNAHQHRGDSLHGFTYELSLFDGANR